MNVKTSPSGAPPLASRSVSGLVWLLSNSCARVPAQLAGDSRNTVSTLPLHVTTQEKHCRAKDHNNQDDPDNAGHSVILLDTCLRGKILHRQTWFHILTHAWDRWWSLWVRGAVLLRRGVRAPLRVEMGLGECRGHGDGQRSIPRLLHLRTARPVWPVPGDVVGAHQESGSARR